jgi:hypothetical protein
MPIKSRQHYWWHRVKMIPRVNINESNQIVEALRKKEWMWNTSSKTMKGMDFHNEENRFEFYHAMENFLAVHLKKQESL